MKEIQDDIERIKCLIITASDAYYELTVCNAQSRMAQFAVRESADHLHKAIKKMLKAKHHLSQMLNDRPVFRLEYLNESE